MNLYMKLYDKETKKTSFPVNIKEVILNQNEIEFKWENSDTLPYKDFLYYLNDYEVIIKVKE